jgi:hypothetical protein
VSAEVLELGGFAAALRSCTSCAGSVGRPSMRGGLRGLGDTAGDICALLDNFDGCQDAVAAALDALAVFGVSESDIFAAIEKTKTEGASAACSFLASKIPQLPVNTCRTQIQRVSLKCPPGQRPISEAASCSCPAKMRKVGTRKSTGDVFECMCMPGFARFRDSCVRTGGDVVGTKLRPDQFVIPPAGTTSTKKKTSTGVKVAVGVGVVGAGLLLLPRLLGQ